MYEFYTEPCQIGQIYDATIRRIYSETAHEDIKFGAPLKFETDGTVSIIAADDPDLVIGISVFDQMKINAVYPAADRVSVMNIGRIWVEVNPAIQDSITAGNPAYVDDNQQFRNDTTGLTDPKKVGLFLDKPATLTEVVNGVPITTYVAPLELNLEI